MTIEEFRKKHDEDEAFRAEVEAKTKALKEQHPDKGDRVLEKMLCDEYGVEMPTGVEIDDEDMDAVAGGWGGEDAPDGHEIGCFLNFTWYNDRGEAGYLSNRCVYCGGELVQVEPLVGEGLKVCYACKKEYNNWGSGQYSCTML